MGRPTPWEPPAERRVRPTPRYHRIGRAEFVGAAGRKSRERRREMTENAREVVGKTSGSDAEADGRAADAVRVAGTCGGAVEGETVLDRYFALSDTAGEAPEDFEELVSLFSPQARIFPGRGGAVEGIDAVRAFYREFFDRNVELRHVWKARVQPDGQHFARWAVAGRRSSDEVFALSGCDVAEMDDVGRILKLRVEID